MYVKIKKISIDENNISSPFANTSKISNTSNCRLNVSKVTTIRDIKDLIDKKMNVRPESQRLFFKGKVLENDLTLCDYNVINNNSIQLMVLHQVDDPETVTEVHSELFKTGDIIDARDMYGHSSTCAWLEGEVTKIVVCTGKHVIAGSDGLTYFVKLEKYPDDKDIKCRVEDIRPRARHTYTLQELEVGMKVFVNHNLKKPDKRGGWFDAKIVKTNPVVVTLFASLPLPRRKITFADEIDCKIIFSDEIMRIEVPVKVVDRTEAVEKVMNTPVARKNPFICDECEDSGSECRDCGCKVCGSKDDPEHTLICDGCESGNCMECLGMKEMPGEEEDWYCPECKEEEDSVKEADLAWEQVVKRKQKDKIKVKDKENKGKTSGLDKDEGESAVNGKGKKMKLNESYSWKY